MKWIKRLLGNRKIAVLIEDGATAGYLISELQKTFKRASISTINCEDIKNNNALDSADLLFIPGVQRASATYRNGLGLAGGNAIKEWIRQGGTAVGLCHGAYLLTEKFQYADKFSGVTRLIHSPCGVFEGMAYGPISDYTDRQNLDNPFIDHHVAKLQFNDASFGAACYAHGPFLKIDPKSNSNDYSVIARFADIRDNPVAIASRKYGKGKAIFCSVVPEVMGAEMGSTDERFISRVPFYETGIKFSKELQKHETERAHVWNKLTNEL